MTVTILKLLRILPLLVILVSTNVICQNNIGIVEYQETDEFNYKGIKSFYTLYFDNNYSLYEENLNKATFGEMDFNESDGTITTIKLPYRDKPKFNFFDFKNNSSMFSISPFGNYTIVNDKDEKISWSLMGETKKIGNFECQKAKAHFRGRNYYVWFTTEIPLSTGPWKLNGLSGLILEVQEENGLIHIIATSINLTAENAYIQKKIGQYTNPKTTISFKDYLKILTDFDQKYERIMNSKLSKGQSPITDSYSFWSLELYPEMN